jgi:hypothetical protein
MEKQRLKCMLCDSAVVYDSYTNSMTCSCNAVQWFAINDQEPVNKPVGGEHLEIVRIAKLPRLYNDNLVEAKQHIPIHQ